MQNGKVTMKLAVHRCIEEAKRLVADHPGITASEASVLLGISPTAARDGLARAAEQHMVDRRLVPETSKCARMKPKWAYYPVGSIPNDGVLASHCDKPAAQAFLSGRVLSLKAIWRGGPAWFRGFA
jgi:hypothetical protein